MTWLMRALPTGSLIWLVAHELRINLRSVNRRAATTWIGLLILAIYIGLGIMTAMALRDTAFTPIPIVFDAALAVCLIALSFMLTQAVLASQRTLYEARDLDLLLSAPLTERRVLAAKLIGITGTIVLTYAALTLPMVVPIAWLGHPGLFGAVALLAALALLAACGGLGITLLLAWIAGPRAARTVGQIAAAMLGGGFFLASQLMTNGRAENGRNAMFQRFVDSRIGEGPIGSIPGRTLFGDPIAIGVMLGGALLLFAVTSRLFQSRFLASYQVASMRMSRARTSRRGIARLYRNSLFGSVFAKEIRLLKRDPALLFQIVLRLIYLAPLVLIAFGGRQSFAPIAPTLAFAGVVIAGQLAGSFAWLTISAEDAPDLLSVAPVDRDQINIAKLLAALAMTAPIGLLLPIAVAVQTPWGGAVALAMTALAAALTAMIELKLGKPMPRKSFNQRRGSGIVAGLLGLMVTMVCGGIAGVGAYFLA